MKIQTEKKVKEPVGKFMGRINPQGTGFSFGEYTRIKLRKFMKENPNSPFELKPIFAESERQRGWFEGALVPLVTFYQEGMDYRSQKDREKVREWLKIEFNGEFVSINGRAHKVAQSTSQRLNLGFLERIVDWLVTNYEPPMEALDPNKYKHWHDTIFPDGGPETYIGYLLEINILKK